MDSEWRKQQIKHAREHFKDFVADFNDYGEVQTLDWRHKDGGSNYHVHYIFDTKQQYMHISGDLGSACFYLTWEPTFENMRNRIRDPWYIIGKLECSTDKYAYPDEYVRSEIEEYYKDWAPARDDYDEGEDSLINALAGDEDEAYEFKMAFGDLCAECEKMLMDLDEEWVPECFDIFFVGAGAGTFGEILGWDSYEQDYMGISCTESFAEDEAKKKLKQMTKDELIVAARQCFKVYHAYIGLRNRYDSLKAAIDVLRDQNTGILQVVKEIEKMYEAASERTIWWDSEYTKEAIEWRRYTDTLPQEVWIQ